ncbi:hypothetical protein BJX64DRAFT_256351 [Aspergillus heterothallicus]
MSHQNGVPFPLASIAAHPTAGTAIRPAINPNSYPSNPSVSAIQSLSSVPTSSNPSRSRTIIPKLSAATTELLARLAGNIRGTTTTQQQKLPKNDKTPSTRNSLPIASNRNIQGANSQGLRTMRVSSLFIDLPTPPFDNPAREEVVAETPVVVATPSTTTPSAPTQPSIVQPFTGSSVKPPAALATIAPKPAVTPSISRQAAPQVPSYVPSYVQSRAEYQPPSFPPRANWAFTPFTYRASTQVQAPESSRPSPVPPVTTHIAPQAPAQARPFANFQPSSLQPRASPISAPVAPSASPQVRPPAHSHSSPLPPVSAHIAPQVPVQVPQPPSKPQPSPSPSLELTAPTTATSTPSNISSRPRPVSSVSTKAVKFTSAPRQRAVAGNRKSLSKKRKRGKDSDGEDVIRAGDSSSDESDFTPTATQTKSGRQVNRPSVYVPEHVIPALPKEHINTSGATDKPQDAAKKRRRVSRKGKSTNSNCAHCQRGHSAPRNVIVFCDRCNRAWHQFCHDPPIERDVITVKEKEWLCRDCNPVEINISHPTVVRSNPSLTWEPPVHVPISPPSIEVGGGKFSTADRRQFLSGLSHATLVELLLTISDKHPTVPMFPKDMATFPVSKFPSSQALISSTEPEPTPTLPATTNGLTPANPTIPAAQNGVDAASTDALPQRPRARYQEISSDEESEYEFQEHRLYPRAGNGVRLSALAEDLDILAEDPACATFSYALHGPMQARIAARVSA